MLLIAHFYNEEYLLPFWLNHHKEIFEHGVLIDSHSTDNSVEIINKTVPTWKVIKSPVKKFNSEIMEKLIMDIESEYENEIKIVLNISEFLIINKKDKFKQLLGKDRFSYWIQAAMMVDKDPISSNITNLLEEKYYGFWHTDLNVYKIRNRYPFANSGYRERLIHNYSNGQYLPGRHKTLIENSKRMSKNIAYIRWYNYSPWNNNFIDRKLSFAKTLSENDIQKNYGKQHLSKLEEMEKLYRYYKKISYNINQIRFKSMLLAVYHLKIFPFSFFFKKKFKNLKKLI